MSTRILEINGIEGILQGTQFFGGKKNGLSLQLTAIGGPKDPLRPINSRYVQFNKSQVQQLVKELQNWLGEVELPFNQSFAGKLTSFPIPPYKSWKSNGQIAFENFAKNTNSYPYRWDRLTVKQQQNWEEMFP